MKLKVENVRIKGYDFSGQLLTDDTIVNVTGSFTVKFKDDYPQVEVEFDDILVPESVVDVEELEAQIVGTDDGSWYHDHLDLVAERKREFMEDR